jgi:hypothetical protein
MTIFLLVSIIAFFATDLIVFVLSNSFCFPMVIFALCEVRSVRAQVVVLSIILELKSNCLLGIELKCLLAPVTTPMPIPAVLNININIEYKIVICLKIPQNFKKKTTFKFVK